MAFSYSGPIPASKSLLNRWLIVQSYTLAGEIVLHGDSQADDVKLMRQALSDFKNGKTEFNCGAAGTVLRFLALRVSREKGEFVLRGSKRLFERPQQELCKILQQLGAKAEMNSEKTYLKITSQGWNIPVPPLEISGAESSQFASAVLLNTIGLEKPLQIKLSEEMVSESYFAMTQQVMQQAAKSKKNIFIELDMSSAFAIAALAALSGKCELQNFPRESLQPDFIFVELLKKMGVHVELKSKTLKVSSTQNLEPIEFNLKNAPDLFPLLAVLCAFVEGKSVLFGAPHLKSKESDRIAKTAELIRLCGRKVEEREDGLVIYGSQKKIKMARSTFDPAEDHRLVMAAAMANAGGADIHILNPLVVNKSFPEFLEITSC